MAGQGRWLIHLNHLKQPIWMQYSMAEKSFCYSRLFLIRSIIALRLIKILYVVEITFGQRKDSDEERFGRRKDSDEETIRPNCVILILGINALPFVK